LLVVLLQSRLVVELWVVSMVLAHFTVDFAGSFAQTPFRTTI
jgi:hypothetical protein